MKLALRAFLCCVAAQLVLAAPSQAKGVPGAIAQYVEQIPSSPTSSDQGMPPPTTSGGTSALRRIAQTAPRKLSGAQLAAVSPTTRARLASTDSSGGPLFSGAFVRLGVVLAVMLVAAAGARALAAARRV